METDRKTAIMRTLAYVNIFGLALSSPMIQNKRPTLSAFWSLANLAVLVYTDTDKDKRD